MDDYYFGNPNINNYNYSMDSGPSSSDQFMISDYLMTEDGVVHNHQHQQHSNCSQSTEIESSDKPTSRNGFADQATSTNINNMQLKCENGIKRKKEEVRQRVTFRTRSQLEIMDDGYKWRKYGKKSVKNSPNPSNYYKCSGEGCIVKKTVERDREDSSYVLTTYNGVHNHESPSYSYTQISLLHHSTSNHCTLQPSANPSSFSLSYIN